MLRFWTVFQYGFIAALGMMVAVASVAGILWATIQISHAIPEPHANCVQAMDGTWQCR